MCALALVSWQAAHASSHREAPAITRHPQVDATDFYLFRSYEAGRDDRIVAIACYAPLQDAYAGPNYHGLDPNALYEIHFDTNGDANEDVTFQFRFQEQRKDISLDVGNPGDTVPVDIPLRQAGPFGAGDTAALNVTETYTLTRILGDRRTGSAATIGPSTGGTVFTKPHDRIGDKSIPDYASYAGQYVYDISIPGCATPGRVFVGQRKDPFVVNLGETFDLVNTNPLGPENGEADSLADKNVTAICLELPIACLVGTDPVIGGWTTASLRQARVLDPLPGPTRPADVHGGAWTQVSRLGMPLVNEVVIGLSNKDRFNASEPSGDTQFATYVTRPTLPELLEVLFGVTAPNSFPRQDLVDVFLLGVDSLNRPTGVVASEMMRLNTSTPVVAQGSQSRMGVLGGDVAGYPNGRRPGDDVVDISLRVVMGVLLPPADAPSGGLAYTDGAFLDDSMSDGAFPFLRAPLAGSPN
ncbi:MAG: DUF4331 domain-containing protein [Planctomycetota bacterium]